MLFRSCDGVEYPVEEVRSSGSQAHERKTILKPGSVHAIADANASKIVGDWASLIGLASRKIGNADRVTRGQVVKGSKALI